MNCRFETLTSVFFKHAYFLNEKFEGLKARPANDCIHMMDRMGLFFKPRKDGFSILFDTHFAGSERSMDDISAGESFTLGFHILLRSPEFYNYTANVSGDLTKSIFYFTNGSQDGEAAGREGMLHGGDSVSEKDVFPLDRFKGQFFSKPFGVLDLHIHKGLKEIYHINFSARATFWRYILVSDYLQELQKPAIVSSDDHYFFEGPEQLMLPDNKKTLSFISKDKINLSESVKSPLRLVENYEVKTGKYKTIINALPLPDIHTISQVGPMNKNHTQSELSEIFIY